MKKAAFNALIFIVVFALTMYGVFSGQDISAIREAIRQCELRWLMPAIVCVVLFIWGESIILWIMMGSYGIRLKKRTCFLFSSVGFFFSCVTPSASGGQPMQVYFMRKEKIPIPVATVILLVVTITYKLVLVVVGIAVSLFGRDTYLTYLGDLIYVFDLGLVLNVVCILILIALVFSPNLVKGIAFKLSGLLEKLHILKGQRWRLKLEASTDTYNETSQFMLAHKGLMLKVFLITCAQRFFLFAVTWFVYQSFGLEGLSFWDITVLTAMISVAVDMLPLPGGMGISETLYLTIFETVFGALLLPGMVLSRGLSYYSELLISACFTCAAFLFLGKRNNH